MDQKIIYRLNDIISFRKCSLYEGEQGAFGDCTNFNKRENNYGHIYECRQNGIHFHCTKHPEVELTVERDENSFLAQYRCPRCNSVVYSEQYKNELLYECLSALNREVFKGAKLIRLDDWYTPEIKYQNDDTGYWLKADVKTDRDGDTIIVLYVGHKDDKEKAQFFIKPEKVQLSSDHKDMDPAKVISKIEVTLRDRIITQEYE